MAGFDNETIIYTTNKIYTTKIGGTIQNPPLAITSISESVSKMENPQNITNDKTVTHLRSDNERHTFLRALSMFSICTLLLFWLHSEFAQEVLA